MLCPEFDVAAPETAEATLALVHFAGVLGADRLMGEVTQAGRRDEPVTSRIAAGVASLAGLWRLPLPAPSIVDRRAAGVVRGEGVAETWGEVAERA